MDTPKLWIAQAARWREAACPRQWRTFHSPTQLQSFTLHICHAHNITTFPCSETKDKVWTTGMEYKMNPFQWLSVLLLISSNAYYGKKIYSGRQHPNKAENKKLSLLQPPFSNTFATEEGRASNIPNSSHIQWSKCLSADYKAVEVGLKQPRTATKILCRSNYTETDNHHTIKSYLSKLILTPTFTQKLGLSYLSRFLPTSALLWF